MQLSIWATIFMNMEMENMEQYLICSPQQRHWSCRITGHDIIITTLTELDTPAPAISRFLIFGMTMKVQTMHMRYGAGNHTEGAEGTMGKQKSGVNKSLS